MPKIVNIAVPPTIGAAPVTNHASVTATSADTHPSGHAKASSGGGGT